MTLANEIPRQVTLQQAMQLAVGYLDENRLSEAEAIFTAVLRAAPNSADGLHFMGILRAQQGRADEAVEFIRRAVSVAPEYAEAHTNLGNIYRSLGKTAEAQASFARTIEIAPDIAEAHLSMADLLRRAGQRAESVPFYQRALALDPTLAQGYFQLGKVYHRLGKTQEADATFRRWLQIDPQHPVARHMVSAIGSATPPDRASQGYVRYEFDDFADTFDAVMNTLAYNGPTHIASALAACPDLKRDLNILDAGCGTGLISDAVRPYARRLVGVDLSAAMIAHARHRGGYDELVIAEITEYLQSTDQVFDLIVSADTLIYFGDLAPLFHGVARCLAPGGSFVFFVEEQQTDTVTVGWNLLPSGRYAHSETYLRRVSKEAGLTIGALTRNTLRFELKQQVRGIIVTARI